MDLKYKVDISNVKVAPYIIFVWCSENFGIESNIIRNDRWKYCGGKIYKFWYITDAFYFWLIWS